MSELGINPPRFAIKPDVPDAAISQRTDVRDFFAKEVALKTADLASFEQIRRVALLPRDLTIEDGELSPTLKINAASWRRSSPT